MDTQCAGSCGLPPAFPHLPPPSSPGLHRWRLVGLLVSPEPLTKVPTSLKIPIQGEYEVGLEKALNRRWVASSQPSPMPTPTACHPELLFPKLDRK